MFCMLLIISAARCFYIFGGTDLSPIEARVLLLGGACSVTDMEVPRKLLLLWHATGQARRPHRGLQIICDW